MIIELQYGKLNEMLGPVNTGVAFSRLTDNDIAEAAECSGTQGKTVFRFFRPRVAKRD